MHNKFWMIDSNVVSTGSMNPTKNYAERNRDNMVIMEDAAVADKYRVEFWRLSE